MQRILGQDPDGTWHVASSTYTATMHTKCGRWLRVIAFAVDAPSDTDRIPWCVTCVNLNALERR
jgi:hypothetical protein